MASTTAYQYVKLGANLEFLRGICTISLMQTTSLAACPHLMENLPQTRYSLVRVVEVMKSVLIQLEEMKLARALEAAEPFRPMLKEMEAYLAETPVPESAFLQDHFADPLVALSRNVGMAVKLELASRAA